CAVPFGFHLLRSLEGSVATIATHMAYPIGDTVLLSLAVSVLAVCGRKADRSLALLVAALAVFAIGDTLYLLEFANGTYAVGNLLDSSWSVAAALMSIGAWQKGYAAPRRKDTVPLLLP